MDLLEIRKKAREAKEAKGVEDSPHPSAGVAMKPVDRPPAGGGGYMEEEISDSPVPAKKVKRRAVKPAARTGKADSQPAVAETVMPASTEVGESSKEEEILNAVPAPADIKDSEAVSPPAQAVKKIDENVSPPESSGPIELLAFMLAGEEYALRMEEAREIIRWRKPTRVPRAPEHVIGIISLRGIILPVFDVKRRLGLGELKPSRSTRIIVVSEGGSLCGMVVDSITGVTAMPREGIEPPPAVIGGNEAEYLEGVGRAGDKGKRLLILIKVSRALAN